MSNYSVSVILKAVDRVSSVVRRIARSLDLTKNIRKLQGEFSQLSQVSGRVFLGMAAAATASAYAFKKMFLDTAVEFEVLRASLGGGEIGRKNFEWIKEYSKSVPYSIAQIGKSFRLLKNAGAKDLPGAIDAITNSTSKLGGTPEHLDRISKAISQMYSKNKVGAEEMTQQLGELIPAWTILSEETGLTSLQLQKMSQKGQLGIEYVDKLVKGMGKWSKGANAALMDTMAGKIAYLSKTFQDFTTDVMESGVFGSLKSGLDSVVQSIMKFSKSGDYEKLVNSVAKAFGEIGQAIKEVGSEMWPVLKPLFFLVKEIVQVVGVKNLARFLIYFGLIAGGVAVVTAALAGLAALASAPVWTIIVGVLVVATAGFFAFRDSIMDGVAAIQAMIADLTNLLNPLNTVKKIADIVWDLFNGKIDQAIAKTGALGRELQQLAGYALLGAGAPSLPGTKQIRSTGQSVGAGAVRAMPRIIKGGGGGAGSTGRQVASADRIDVNVKIDQDGRARVASIANTGRKTIADVDMGMVV